MRMKGERNRGAAPILWLAAALLLIPAAWWMVSQRDRGSPTDGEPRLASPTPALETTARADGPSGAGTAAAAAPKSDEGRPSGLEVVVVDGAGQPIGGAEVAADRDGRDPLLATAGADGRAVLPLGPGEGSWTVGARAPGFAPGLRGGVPADTGRIEIRLGRGWRLHGTVRDHDGMPLGGITVALRLDLEGFEGGFPGVRRRSDESGRWEFNNLPRVGGRVRAEREGRRPVDVDYSAPDADEVEREVTLEFPPTAHLAGEVRDDAGRPVAGIRVWATDAAGKSLTALTDAAGRWRMEGLDAGEHAVSCGPSADGLLAEVRLRDVVAPGDGIVLSMPREPHPPGSYRLTCVGPEGSVLTSAQVSLLAEPDGEPRGASSLRADTDGVLRARQVPSGHYVLDVRSSDLLARSAPFEVREGEEADLGTLRLRRGVVVRVRVLDSGGRPLPGATATVLPGRLAEREAADENGCLEITGVGPRARLALRARDHDDLMVVADGDPGSIVDLGEQRLEAAGGIVEGEVSAEGPLPSTLRIGLRRLDGDPLEKSRRVGCDDEGRFRFDGVPAGRWHVSVTMLVSSPDSRATFTRGSTGEDFDLAAGEHRTLTFVLPR